MIPEATETIASSIQSGCPCPPTGSPIIDTIIGAVIAVAVGLVAVEYRWWKENKAQRRWIASGLLNDVQRTKEILQSLPVGNRVEAKENFVEFVRKLDLKNGMLYPRNGLFSTHYAEIFHLGPTIAKEISNLYETINRIELVTYAVSVGIINVGEYFKEGTPNDVFPRIVEANKQITKVLKLLKEIVPDTPVD